VARSQKVIQFGALPRDPDRDAALVELRHPQRTRDDIVVSADLAARIDRIENEFRSLDLLAKSGLSPRSRLLFVGPPGCGKTLCAEILASDLELTLLTARFDGIVSSYLGETATNLRRAFNYAAQQSAILFFDEFDAIGKKRDDPQEVGELKRVVGSFLQILDAHPRDHMVIAATNHEGLLDDALWRRFDEVLFFGRPNQEQLVRLAELRLRGVRKRGVELERLSREMDGFSFADAERVCSEAVKAMLLSGRRDLTPDLLEAELRQQRERMSVAQKGPGTIA
jgi:SpoVK/Ycf46/Vps4 family AAA+-type ATPase